MPKKKLGVIIAIFVAYCVLLVYISANYRKSDTAPEAEAAPVNTEQEAAPENTEQNVAEEAPLAVDLPAVTDLLSADIFAAASIDGKADADTPWKSNIALLGDEYSEQGLFMMPGTGITFTAAVPEGAKLAIDAKLFDAIAESGISDGVTLVVEVRQDGDSLNTYAPIAVTGDGQVNSAELDFAEWQGRTLQINIKCYDGGKDDAVGDWCVIKALKLTQS